MRLIGQECKHGDMFSSVILIGRGLVLEGEGSKRCLSRMKLFYSVLRVLKNAPLAQLVEQLTLNQWVLGSSPRWCTKKARWSSG